MKGISIDKRGNVKMAQPPGQRRLSLPKEREGTG
jgi:hypothetical protein